MRELHDELRFGNMVSLGIRPTWKITAVDNGGSYARRGKKQGNGQDETGSHVSHKGNSDR